MGFVTDVLPGALHNETLQVVGTGNLRTSLARSDETVGSIGKPGQMRKM